MTTPALTITAQLNSAPVSRAAELDALDQLTRMAVHQARSTGGNNAQSGTVNAAFGARSATWVYTPTASS
jgi:hypothetical protein